LYVNLEQGDQMEKVPNFSKSSQNYCQAKK
jgi:hypothetical protein